MSAETCMKIQLDNMWPECYRISRRATIHHDMEKTHHPVHINAILFAYTELLPCAVLRLPVVKLATLCGGNAQVLQVLQAHIPSASRFVHVQYCPGTASQRNSRRRMTNNTRIDSQASWKNKGGEHTEESSRLTTTLIITAATTPTAAATTTATEKEDRQSHNQ